MDVMGVSRVSASLKWQAVRAPLVVLLCGIMWITGMQLQAEGRTRVDGFLIPFIGSVGLFAPMLIRVMLRSRVSVGVSTGASQIIGQNDRCDIPPIWTPWDLVWASPALLVFPCSIVSWIIYGSGLVDGLFVGLIAGTFMVFVGILRVIVTRAWSHKGAVYSGLAGLVVLSMSYLSVLGCIGMLGV